MLCLEGGSLLSGVQSLYSNGGENCIKHEMEVFWGERESYDSNSKAELGSALVNSMDTDKDIPAAFETFLRTGFGWRFHDLLRGELCGQRNCFILTDTDSTKVSMCMQQLIKAVASCATSACHVIHYKFGSSTEELRRPLEMISMAFQTAGMKHEDAAQLCKSAFSLNSTLLRAHQQLLLLLDAADVIWSTTTIHPNGYHIAGDILADLYCFGEIGEERAIMVILAGPPELAALAFRRLREVTIEQYPGLGCGKSLNFTKYVPIALSSARHV